MKMGKQVVGLLALLSLATTQIGGVHAANSYSKSDLPVTYEVIHKPFWLFNDNDKRSNYERMTECVSSKGFSILDDDGSVISTVDAVICEGDEVVSSSTPNYTGNTGEVDEMDAFLNDLFNSSDSTSTVPVKNEAPVETSGEDEIDSLLNDLFGTTTSESATTELVETKTVEPKVVEEAATVEPKVVEEATTDNSGDDEIDKFLEDLFSININERLDTAVEIERTTLAGNQLATSIKSFAKLKKTMNVGGIPVNGLEGEGYYNAKVADLLHSVNSEFKIDSIKADFAKNISQLSYSLSTYISDESTTEVREAFRVQLIKDIKQLKKKYSVLKNKDSIISKTLEARKAL